MRHAEKAVKAWHIFHVLVSSPNNGQVPTSASRTPLQFIALEIKNKKRKRKSGYFASD